MSERVKCETCGKTFRENNDLFNHMKAKHPKAKRAHLRPEHEQSMGELLAEAQMAHMCGEPVDDWIVHMFPDQFEDRP